MAPLQLLWGYLCIFQIWALLGRHNGAVYVLIPIDLLNISGILEKMMKNQSYSGRIFQFCALHS